MPTQLDRITGVQTDKITFADSTSFDKNNVILKPSQPQVNDLLVYNGSTWNPSAAIANGDITGATTNLKVTKIQGVAVSNSTPQSGQVLTYNGAQWIGSTL